MMGYGGPMMDWGGGSSFGIFAVLTWLIWTIVGVELVIFLWKKIK